MSWLDVIYRTSIGVTLRAYRGGFARKALIKAGAVIKVRAKP